MNTYVDIIRFVSYFPSANLRVHDIPERLGNVAVESRRRSWNTGKYEGHAARLSAELFETLLVCVNFTTGSGQSMKFRC